MMLECGKRGVLAAFTTLILLLTAFVAQAETVKTKYFSIDLPAGWQTPVPVKEGGDSLVAAFVQGGGKASVVITVGADTQSAKELAAASFAKMKRAGITPSEPVEKNGLWEMTFPHPVMEKGQIWIGANGKEYAVTLIGTDIEVGKAFLKGLKPVDPKIFPKF